VPLSAVAVPTPADDEPSAATDAWADAYQDLEISSPEAPESDDTN
jgi:hypothetical protein